MPDSRPFFANDCTDHLIRYKNPVLMSGKVTKHDGFPNLRGKSLVERIGDMGPLFPVGLIGARLAMVLRSGVPAEDGRRTSSMKVTCACRQHTCMQVDNM